MAKSTYFVVGVTTFVFSVITYKRSKKHIDGLIGYLRSFMFPDTCSVGNGARKNDPFPKELKNEQLSRNIAFLGQDKVDLLADCLAIVVGCGGVGSHAAHMLARSGVGHIRLIDFDNVTLSSLNRAPLAQLKDVGLSKVEHLSEALERICPWVRIEPVPLLLTIDSVSSLLSIGDDRKYSSCIVLDCIDNVHTKLDLLEYCYKNKIGILSAAGAGCKWDPTKISISDISKTSEDPLCRSIRQKLRSRGIAKGIPVVYSTERYSGVALKQSSNDKEGEETKRLGDYSVLPNFRSGIVPVLGPMPAIFGMTMAMYAIKWFLRDPNDSSCPFAGG